MSPDQCPASIALAEYLPRPELVVETHPVTRARFPAIDAHHHLGGIVGQGPEAISRLVAEMDECNLKACFDLDGGRGAPLQQSLQLGRTAQSTGDGPSGVIRIRWARTMDGRVSSIDCG